MTMKEEKIEQEKFLDLVRKDIETNFEFDHRKDERWTKAISESNGDKEKAKHRYLQLRKKMLLDQVIRDIAKLIVINIVIIILFVTVTSVFEKPVFEKMEGSVGRQFSYPQGEPLDERFLTPAQKERSGMKLFPGTGLDRTLEFFRTWDSQNID